MNNPLNFLGFKQVLVSALYALIVSIAYSLIQVIESDNILILLFWSTWKPILLTGLSTFVVSLLAIFVNKRQKFKKSNRKIL